MNTTGNSRIARWNRAVVALETLQQEYREALGVLESKDSLTGTQEDMVTNLEEMCDHDISELEMW